MITEFLKIIKENLQKITAEDIIIVFSLLVIGIYFIIKYTRQLYKDRLDSKDDLVKIKSDTISAVKEHASTEMSIFQQKYDGLRAEIEVLKNKAESEIAEHNKLKIDLEKEHSKNKELSVKMKDIKEIFSNLSLLNEAFLAVKDIEKYQILQKFSLMRQAFSLLRMGHLLRNILDGAIRDKGLNEEHISIAKRFINNIEIEIDKLFELGEMLDDSDRQDIGSIEIDSLELFDEAYEFYESLNLNTSA
ncbi:hypothetical protein RB620_21535 [Paenibacillus sp. LHD-117]|uniref:hypothetical protein n=1 Tax=Paenibacillus sp. LHD-117 TaxID=3071412 RepID=UPI0027E0C79C|nr:hypothetical protein [Paenibacillus sp. LHD-117]MDQ6422016.1 hypothetical protein [Paenibacillus sp. LHD-117]